MASNRPQANSTQTPESGATGRLASARRASTKSLLLVAMFAGLCVVGCKKVAVPTLVNLDLDQAKQTLTAAGLKQGNISGGQGTGAYVVAQSLAPNQQVAPNSPVDLTVALPLAVPDLTNKNVTDAVSILQSMGLKVMFVKEPKTKLFGGPKVTAQSPVAATLVHPDALVTLTVQAPPNWTALVGLVTKEPAYEKLNPEYRQVLDTFLK